MYLKVITRWAISRYIHSYKQKGKLSKKCLPSPNHQPFSYQMLSHILSLSVSINSNVISLLPRLETRPPHSPHQLLCPPPPHSATAFACTLRILWRLSLHTPTSLCETLCLLTVLTSAVTLTQSLSAPAQPNTNRFSQTEQTQPPNLTQLHAVPTSVLTLTLPFFQHILTH